MILHLQGQSNILRIYSSILDMLQHLDKQWWTQKKKSFGGGEAIGKENNLRGHL